MPQVNRGRKKRKMRGEGKERRAFSKVEKDSLHGRGAQENSAECQRVLSKN